MTGGVPNRGAKSPHAKLAKAAAEHMIKQHDFLPPPASLTSELALQRACFITIFENPGKRLRTTYGQPLPRSSRLAEEIIVNTSYAVQSHVRRADLPYLSYAVDVVEPLQRVTSVEHLDPAQYGLYIRSDQGHSALILPRRVGIETPEDQLATALRESGIDQRQETFILYRFLVIRYD
jgi:AMMECR1 domain-containing protein